MRPNHGRVKLKRTVGVEQWLSEDDPVGRPQPGGCLDLEAGNVRLRRALMIVNQTAARFGPGRSTCESQERQRNVNADGS